MHETHGWSRRLGWFVVLLTVLMLSPGYATAAEPKQFTLINVDLDGTKIWLLSSIMIYQGDEVELTLIKNLAPSGRTLLISDVPDASPTTSSHPQVCQRELCHGLCPSPVRSSSWGAAAARPIPPPLNHLQLVIDHAVTRMPHLPEQHLPAAPRTSQRITPRTRQHALTIGLVHDDAIRALDQPT